jgi:putative restriction endonuclease
MSLCKIHHGAYDTDIIGISPDYTVHVRESVLATFDGPTLQHSIKEMDGEALRQIPKETTSKPDRELLAERFEKFQQVS